MAKHTTNPTTVVVAEDGTWSCTITDMTSGPQFIQMKVDGAIILGPNGTQEFEVGKIQYIGAGAFIHSQYQNQPVPIPAPNNDLRAGDFLLLVISVDSAFVGIEDGWTLLVASSSSRLYYRFCPSPSYAGATIYADPADAYLLVARLYVFRNVDSSTPFDRKDTGLTFHTASGTWTGTGQGGIAASSMAIFVGVSLSTPSVSAGVGIDTVDLSTTTSPLDAMQFVGYDVDSNGQSAAPTVTLSQSRAGYSWTAALKMK